MTHRIPSVGGLESLSVAARVISSYNVIEAPKSVRVQPRIEETTRGVEVGNTVVINQ